jgi:hypothetical protein
MATIKEIQEQLATNSEDLEWPKLCRDPRIGVYRLIQQHHKKVNHYKDEMNRWIHFRAYERAGWKSGYEKIAGDFTTSKRCSK